MGNSDSKAQHTGKPLKVSGAATLYQSTSENVPFDETQFNIFFEEAERTIFKYSRTEEGTKLFNNSKPPMMIKNREIKRKGNGTMDDFIKKYAETYPPDEPTAQQVTINKTDESISRDITQEIESIPLIIKERAKTIVEYFLLNRLATKNVFRNQEEYGMYKVISFAIIEYFLTMYEWDNIFKMIHREPVSHYDPFILQDVTHFIKGMLFGFEIVPANPIVSQEISEMMNLVIGEIVRSSAFYGGKMSKRSAGKHKRMKRRTVKRIKKVLVN